MKKYLLITLTAIITLVARAENPVSQLVDRIDKGAAKEFLFELSEQTSPDDFFVLDQKRGKVWIKGNNWISVATGLNWYLKYHAGVHISWNNPKANLSDLPKVRKAERRSTDKLKRYYLNYCTFSYSMAFWDWQRWQQEIDWMALHGINMPLALNGTATVWRNTLHQMGYETSQIDSFIASPIHQAWWLMGNMQGAGAEQIPEQWYVQQEELQKKIVARYRQWGITPVFAGYSGMVPMFDGKTCVIDDSLEQEKWCGFTRPKFLEPTDPRFGQMAKVYYAEMNKLFGEAQYYAIDLFHEGAATKEGDLVKSGKAVYQAMKENNPLSKWVIQAWQQNPRLKLIEGLPAGDVIILDLFSESRPQWGDVQSSWYRENGFEYHDWIYCMLLNFGGNVGMYGKMDRVISGYYLAQREHNGRNMIGVGATMEGIENNAAMFELLFELPWRETEFTKKEWVNNWTKARYGKRNSRIDQAWAIIANTSYSDDFHSVQEGTSESVFCARPAIEIPRTSSWGSTKSYYKSDSLFQALKLMVFESEKFKGNNNFEYDIVDLARQCVADQGKIELEKIREAFDSADSLKFDTLSNQFLELILLQDELLNSRKEFMLGTWIEQAMAMGETPQERDYYRANAKTLITTWGDKEAANIGGLRDYSHREWAGITKDLYYKRWKMFFDYVNQYKELPLNYDFFEVENDWAKNKQPYAIRPTNDPIQQAVKAYFELKKLKQQ